VKEEKLCRGAGRRSASWELCALGEAGFGKNILFARKKAIHIDFKVQKQHMNEHQLFTNITFYKGVCFVILTGHPFKVSIN
jgi:hypothetical protein